MLRVRAQRPEVVLSAEEACAAFKRQPRLEDLSQRAAVPDFIDAVVGLLKDAARVWYSRKAKRDEREILLLGPLAPTPLPIRIPAFQPALQCRFAEDASGPLLL